MDAVVESYQQGRSNRCKGWEVYRYLHSIPLDEHRVTGNFLEINDFTEDFDFPKDLKTWLRNYHGDTGRRWWNPLSWKRAA